MYVWLNRRNRPSMKDAKAIREKSANLGADKRSKESYRLKQHSDLSAMCWHAASCQRLLKAHWKWRLSDSWNRNQFDVRQLVVMIISSSRAFSLLEQFDRSCNHNIFTAFTISDRVHGSVFYTGAGLRFLHMAMLIRTLTTSSAISRLLLRKKLSNLWTKNISSWSVCKCHRDRFKVAPPQALASYWEMRKGRLITDCVTHTPAVYLRRIRWHQQNATAIYSPYSD